MNRKRAAFMAFLVVLGISTTTAGVYHAVDTVGAGPSNAPIVVTVHSLTWWSPCSQPPSHPNDEIANLEADIAAGRQVAGYFLIAPPAAFGLPDTPEGRVEAGRRDADIARENVPQDDWDKLLFASGDTEVPGVCSPYSDVPIETIDAAMAEMATFKCLANATDVCTQVNYTSPNEWLNHVKPPCVVVAGTCAQNQPYVNNPFPVETLLWLADWDGDPSFASFDRHPFAGLTKADIIMKQNAGYTLLNGASVDLDSIEVDPRIFDVQPLTPTPTPTPATPTNPTPTPTNVATACAPGDYEWSPGECAHWDGGEWLSPLRIYVPLGSGPGIWFDRETGVLTAP